MSRAPENFDSDGKLDVAVYGPAGGKWYVWTAVNAPLSQSFGLNASC